MWSVAGQAKSISTSGAFAASPRWDKSRKPKHLSKTPAGLPFHFESIPIDCCHVDISPREPRRKAISTLQPFQSILLLSFPP